MKNSFNRFSMKIVVGFAIACCNESKTRTITTPRTMKMTPDRIFIWISITIGLNKWLGKVNSPSLFVNIFGFHSFPCRHSPWRLSSHHAIAEWQKSLSEVLRSTESAFGLLGNGCKQATRGVRQTAANRAWGEIQAQSAHFKAVSLCEERERRRWCRAKKEAEKEQTKFL